MKTRYKKCEEPFCNNITKDSMCRDCREQKIRKETRESNYCFKGYDDSKIGYCSYYNSNPITFSNRTGRNEN
jgi:hypothetical protein